MTTLLLKEQNHQLINNQLKIILISYLKLKVSINIVMTINSNRSILKDKLLRLVVERVPRKIISRIILSKLWILNKISTIITIHHLNVSNSKLSNHQSIKISVKCQSTLLSWINKRKKNWKDRGRGKRKARCRLVLG